jgi:uncharacterized protein
VHRLVLIGLVGGFFSALFGVGGGIVIVPLLLLLARYAERAAMATSLLAIGVTALVGAAGYGLLGRVHPREALLVGVPAALGAITGTALQQRLGGRALRIAFAVLLVGIAVFLIL